MKDVVNSDKGTDINILRVFENWLLIRDKSNRITWIRLEDVRRIESVQDVKRFHGFLCVIWKHLCWRATSQDGKDS